MQQDNSLKDSVMEVAGQVDELMELCCDDDLLDPMVSSMYKSGSALPLEHYCFEEKVPEDSLLLLRRELLANKVCS